MKQFYYTDTNDAQIGPVTLEEIRTKNIKRDTMVWHEGLENWQRADTIEELKPLFATPPPLKKETITPTPPPISKPIAADSSSPKQKNKNLLFASIGGGILILAAIIYFFNHSKQQAIQQATEQARIEAATVIENKEKEAQIAAEVAFKELEKQVEAENKAMEKKMRDTRNKWYELITVQRSNYTYQEIGGIYDLYLTVTNNTDYTLDYVVASVSYIKSNGDIFKTEALYFENIPPKSWKKLKAPDSNRGTKVDYITINSAASEQFNFCYSEGNWANNSKDPYKCK